MTQRAFLLHSGGFTSRQWRKLGEILSLHFNVLAPDLLGYGEGGPWPAGKPFHFRQDLDYVESLLGDGDDRAHLVGHSYGGFLALQLAIRRPGRVASIAVFDPVAFGILDDVEDADARSQLDLVKQSWEPDGSGVDENWLRGFIDWWQGADAWERLGEDTRNVFRKVGWKVFQEVITLAADRTDRATYATIDAPTLILGGALSPLAERRVVERLGAALPHATARFLDGVGHMGPISHAKLVNEAIAAHLATHQVEQ
jgi:pimeloyl-ACP methyl ester carboxylesterase